MESGKTCQIKCHRFSEPISNSWNWCWPNESRGFCKIAIEQAAEAGKLTDAVLASDAFFPMDDSVEYAAKRGIKAIIQPGGSIKDQASIEMADQYGVAMIFTGVRHFRH